MSLSIEQISMKVDALRRRSHARDGRMADILAIRKGNMEAVYPDFFPEALNKPMVANFVDVAARDISEVIAPLPSLNCMTVNTTSDRSRERADKRTMIVNHYAEFSKLQTQMYSGADWYLTYGFLPVVIEPDVENRMPRIRLENPMGAYPEFDRYGRVTAYAKRYVKTLGELVVEFPEYERQLVGDTDIGVDYNGPIDMIRYEDKDQVVLYLPNRKDLVLRRTENPLGDIMVRVVVRPGIDEEPRGQFDDIMWVQLARARFALLAMEAAEKSVQAPLALPNDVQEFTFGPDAVLRSQNPERIRRVGLDVPNAAFAESALLQQEMRLGARYPEGRTGQIDASIITGQAVQALLGGFDSQVKAAQQVLTQLFEDVFALSMKMDEKLFPGEKTVRGVQGSAPYELKYSPEKDIKGDYTVQVRYGLMAGLDPSRALIFSLQALGADLVSRDFVMRELPWSMNVGQEQQQIDIQKMRDNLNASISSLAATIPAMAAQGADPSDTVRKIAEVIKARRNGQSIEDAASDIFAPPEPVEPPMEDMLAGSPQAAPGALTPVEQATVPGAPAAVTPGAPNVEEILSRLAG
jgi:hypothetical protein